MQWLYFVEWTVTRHEGSNHRKSILHFYNNRIIQANHGSPDIFSTLCWLICFVCTLITTQFDIVRIRICAHMHGKITWIFLSVAPRSPEKQCKDNYGYAPYGCCTIGNIPALRPDKSDCLSKYLVSRIVLKIFYSFMYISRIHSSKNKQTKNTITHRAFWTYNLHYRNPNNSSR